MFTWVLIALFVYSLLAFYLSFREVKKGNTHGTCFLFFPLGAFVWADAVILSLFWILVSVSFYFYSDFYLFLITVSVFWFIRSIGETIYWFLEQFTEKHHNPPKQFFHYALFKNESVWFVNQLYWQILSVVSGILSLIFIKEWVFS